MKNLLLTLVLLLSTTTTIFAQKSNYQLSSHILDISRGKPVSNVQIILYKQDEKGLWVTIDKKVTDNNGRVNDFLKQESALSHSGVYKLSFLTHPYFTSLGQKSFYPYIEVIFELEGNNHYHVPITLSAFGYSTYRGN